MLFGGRALALLDMPENIQQQVDTGAIAARSAYELTKVDNAGRQQELAAKAATGMTLKQTQDAVTTRRRKCTSRQKGPKRLEFFAENGWKLIAIAPNETKLRTYHHLQEAIDHVREDVQTRINGNIRID